MNSQMVSTVYIDDEGTRRWVCEDNGEWASPLHRKNGPAVEYADGHKEWYQYGELHRIGGPAVEYSDHTKEWWQEGKQHRTGGPAVEHPDGGTEWYQYGELHRLDGPALEYADGHKEWRQDGELHRISGPAIGYANGGKSWYIEGRRHRLDGPAQVSNDGSECYFINGTKCQSEDIENYKKLVAAKENIKDITASENKSSHTEIFQNCVSEALHMMDDCSYDGIADAKNSLAVGLSRLNHFTRTNYMRGVLNEALNLLSGDFSHGNVAKAKQILREATK